MSPPFPPKGDTVTVRRSHTNTTTTTTISPGRLSACRPCVEPASQPASQPATSQPARGPSFPLGVPVRGRHRAAASSGAMLAGLGDGDRVFRSAPQRQAQIKEDKVMRPARPNPGKRNQ